MDGTWSGVAVGLEIRGGDWDGSASGPTRPCGRGLVLVFDTSGETLCFPLREL